MTVGTIQTIVVCAPADVSQAPCPAGQAATTVQGYVLDASQAQNIEAQNAPFDYAVAASIWGFVFTFVVSLYLVSKSAGVILNFLRR